MWVVTTSHAMAVLCVQMVWESGCVVIVMLTPLSENGVRQCYHYWPDEGSNLYHVYEVLHQGACPGPLPPCSHPMRPGPHREPGRLACSHPQGPWSGPLKSWLTVTAA